MGICRYCGQKAGWFKHAHDECAKKAQQQNEAVQGRAAEAGVEAKQQVDVKENIQKVPPAPEIGKWRPNCGYGDNIVTAFWLESESPWLSERGAAQLFLVWEPLSIWLDPKIAISARASKDHCTKDASISVDNRPYVRHVWWQWMGRHTLLELDANERRDVFNEMVKGETLTIRVKSRKGCADVVFRVVGLKNALEWVELQTPKRHELQEEFQRKINGVLQGSGAVQCCRYLILQATKQAECDRLRTPTGGHCSSVA